MDKADRTPGDGELAWPTTPGWVSHLLCVMKQVCKQICLWLFILNFLSLENIHNRI